MTAPETKAHLAGEIACDEVLFERLRVLRKKLADERDVPAYIIFSDVALRQMARELSGEARATSPGSAAWAKRNCASMAGFFSRKSPRICSQIRARFLRTKHLSPPFPQRSSLGDTARETLRRFRAGESVAQIAAGRNLVVGTIFGHLATAIEAGETIDCNRLVNAEAQAEIAAAFKQTGWANIVGARELLGEKYDYGLLRTYRAAKTTSFARL